LGCVRGAHNMDPISCWHCTLPCTQTVSLPYRRDSKDTFLTYGYFCSWECAKAYNLKLPSFKSVRQAEMLTSMRYLCEGRLDPVKPAPSRYVLKKFGGTLSEEEYRRGVSPPTAMAVRTIFLPFVLEAEDATREKEREREEKKRNKSREDHDEKSRVQKAKTLVASSSGDDAPKLRLKRSAPLQRDLHSIDRLMGKLKRP